MGRIKLGKQYMPGETIPAGESVWCYFKDDKTKEIFSTSYTHNFRVSEANFSIHFRFHPDYQPPKAPEPPRELIVGELYQVKNGSFWKIRRYKGENKYMTGIYSEEIGAKTRLLRRDRPASEDCGGG